MILLDTNIISEMMKASPSTKVMVWIDQQEVAQLFVSTITIAEISYGINALPEGARRRSLETAFDMTINKAFTNRVLSFDEEASHLYGKLMAHRKTLGKPLNVLDGQIAAIAVSHKASVATRNIDDFKECGLHLINPFD